MRQLASRLRSNIYILEIIELFAISLLWVIWGIFDGRSFTYIVQLVGTFALILLFAWAFYLLMIYLWRSTPLWLIIGLAILTVGASIALYIYLAVFDLNRLILGRLLYTGDAPLEYFWNKQSSEDLREWKKARQTAKTTAQ